MSYETTVNINEEDGNITYQIFGTRTERNENFPKYLCGEKADDLETAYKLFELEFKRVIRRSKL